ncbi:MAG TPA: 3-phosphoserine/phosphohydroxythreonine transaminase [Aromatoleum sp.]|uniref:3-phosphoserine/phosphohydroxythreonine transaminase n=1 Tax=Aromatoleum sp. TaxID=2307007 RepID=UPI002B4932A1|nr:3-phosphoserine/phosphohydroxythreonine transaminase [Aromatoleum sp.]HJV28295.1 3-phosphoserine/phosphohydroxythreonine transaminase [Aromatoleum sp.]
MTRVFNFSAGPAALPEAVLRQAAEEMLDWHGAGCGVMEMSHRGKEFGEIIGRAEADLRELLGIPSNYRVLFLQGGATQQFAQIPMNLLRGGVADYLVTGSWSKKAYKEAQHLAASGLGGSVRLAGSAEAEGFTRLLRQDELTLDDNATYVHLCTNETIHGVELGDEAALPATRAPLVADMSSHILSRSIDVSRYGLIYAGAQKNVGPSGLVIVIVREDLIGRAHPMTPAVMDYKVMADNGSMLNTPPTYAIYIAGLVFQWLKAQGGLAAIEAQNIEKADLLYRFLDNSDFYENRVAVTSRSRMNIPFLLRSEALNDAFLAEAKAVGLTQLKGHKSVGGMRASIYNAMPIAGVRALVEFMQDFAARHG